MDIGSAVGRAAGVSETQMRDLARYRDSDAYNELEKLVIEYAEEVTRTPVDVSEALFSGLRRYFDEAQIVELTAAIAWENYRARFNHALAIESQGFSEGAFCVLPERPATAASERRAQLPAALEPRSMGAAALKRSPGAPPDRD